MDRRPGIDAHIAAKKRQYAKQKRRARIIVVTLLCITILAVWGLLGVVAYRLFGPQAPALETTTPVTTDSVPAVTTSAATVATTPPGMQKITLANADVHTGDLILVSTLLQMQYVFPTGADGILPLYGNKSGSYRISSTSLALKDTALEALNKMFDACYAETGKKDYQITQGYRTLDEQTEIYDSYQETYGAEQGALLAAQPGYSEHHTGYAFDMNVFTAGGVSYSLASAGETDAAYNWIYDNAAKYGFVLRYPEEKTAVTGITNEPWHFRYVGCGHAAYMEEHGLTLEEYIAVVRDHPENGTHLTFTYDGTAYEVYYKDVNAYGDTTELTLPADAVYTVSGDNDCGFIITVVG